MTVKVRLRHGKWAIVAECQGRRKQKTIGKGKKMRMIAESLATRIEMLLPLEGLKALDLLQPDKSVPAFEEYARLWLEQVKTSIRLTTWASYESNLRVHLFPMFGTLRLNQISYAKLKPFIQGKLDEKKSRNTIRIMMATLRVVLEEARREELIPSNPVYKVGKLYAQAPKREHVDPFAEWEIRAILTRFQERFPKYYEFVLLLHRTGMRVGEAMALRWEDLAFKSRKILVRRNFPTGLSKKVLSEPKTSRGYRRVDISPQLSKALIEHRSDSWKRYFKEGKTMPDWVFVNEADNPIHYRKFRELWKRAQALAKVRYRPPHQLRHTFASVLLSAGEPPLWVAAQLGDNMATVFRIYAHYIPAKPVEADGRSGVERLDDRSHQQDVAKEQ
ncbi:site-specific integrase [Acidobacteria bacterium AH-259-A15]|nr:site-specific integrase [Acidobacteria bacterium AH-259-A15]